jgi:anti-sigma regulatory factor (Ser/Thr protein kinase)
VIPLGPGDTAAVPVLRAITRRVLTGWQITADRVDDIELAVSELTANALIHTRGPVRVRLAHRRGTLRLDVADTSTHRPEPADADQGGDLENGRGLGIVAALADRMHTEPYSTGRNTGKVTVVEFYLS